jgi:adenylosuccinate synthase
VGNGPFPTELIDQTGERLRTIGGEFGATTGRPRRCGWLDMVSLRYSIQINGIDSIALTKMDVLDEFDDIFICVGYKLGGKKLSTFPTDVASLEKVQPIYKKFRGWKSSISGARTFRQLPPAARAYVHAIEELTGVRVSIVSVGARRDQTIVR